MHTPSGQCCVHLYACILSTSFTSVSIFSVWCYSSVSISMIETREEVFMEGPIEPNTGPSLADVLLCTFESTNAGFSSFPVRELLS